MDEMLKVLNKYPNGTYLILHWEKEEISLEGIIDTMYESNNGLDEDEDGYLEFYACAFKIYKIIQKPSDYAVKANELIEISILNKPSIIKLKDGMVIWNEK